LTEPIVYGYVQYSFCLENENRFRS